MREIKYQCIDLEDKIIWTPLLFEEIIEGGWEMNGVYYEDGEYDEKGDATELSHYDFNFMGNNNIIWRQYTGFKDKNGVEIYEGDIVKSEDVEGVVKMIDGAFDIYQDDIRQYYDDMRQIYFTESNMEVIGNIYNLTNKYE